MTKLKYETIVETLDTETGELIPVTTTKTFSIKTNSEEFYMTFVKSASALFNLTSAIDIKVIIKLCMIAEFDTGEVQLSTAKRSQICYTLKIVNQQLSNSIASLKKKGLLSGEKGLFVINPIIFWKGTMKKRDELLNGNKLKYVIEFENINTTGTND
jgi:hypothetical protein